MELIEEWRRVAGCPGYEVSNLGRLRSSRYHHDRHVMKPPRDTYGYVSARMRVDGRLKVRRLHRLVMEAFTIPTAPEVNHLDGDKGNNALRNLEWTTRGGNMRHARRAGLMRCRPTAGKPLFDAPRAAEIRGRYQRGEASAAGLAIEYGVSLSTIYKITSGRSYGAKHAHV